MLKNFIYDNYNFIRFKLNSLLNLFVLKANFIQVKW